MTARQLAVHPEAPDRKPRDDEIEIYGLAHRQNRNDKQDQFLVSQLRKQMVVTLSSLADADQLLAGSQRVALLMMVADGVGRHQRRGGEPDRAPLVASEPHEDFENSTTSPPLRGWHARGRPAGASVLWAKIWKAPKEQWEKQCAA
jgi:hypothetical protein